MKRSEPPRRKAPLKRSRPLPKSKSQAKLERTHRAARSNFRGEFPTCWFCGLAPTTDCHEITANGSCKREAYGERCTWGAACNDCNCNQLTNKHKAAWPLERQLAKKWINDRAWFDLEKFNHIRRGLKQIKWPDVVVWICREIGG